ncbi:hypothetical protein GA0115255_106283 [Streptomyces sp. Ncost-T6T-2b]|nr:hypothetical protein GA0115255_106283 [Streptomyces sp. Ncost-T6T-2b]
MTKAANFGWPFCVGDNEPYIDYDFATKTSGAAFDCANLKNESPHNTGLVDLPPAEAAWIPYDGGSVPEFGSGSESPIGRTRLPLRRGPGLPGQVPRGLRRRLLRR